MAPPNRPNEARSDERMAVWMAEYGPALRRYFGRSVGAGEAEDLVQEVFLAMQVRGAHETVENASGYLFRIAANLLAKRRQREPWHWERHAGLEGVYEPREEISPERTLIAKQTAAGVLEALKALPPRTAEAFLLHRFEEMTYAAIAARMGVSVKAVEALIARAMKRVGAVLEARP
ncbi:MAG TPA: sigma-70 family RNA polymerase sigma factor [Caulobacteraceae bacterium]|nr:sigma-70 family RNA polymerase sigma factor [Caulobacteraceae bacterium]